MRTDTFSDLLPSSFVLDEICETSTAQLSRVRHQGRHTRTVAKSSLDDIAIAMKQDETGLKFSDRRWQLRKYHDTFLGHELVDWLIAQYSDINTRQEALVIGNQLQAQGLFRHVYTGGAISDEGRRLLECARLLVICDR
jgi:hypothetical protein